MMELESLIINPAAQGTSARKKKSEKTQIASCGSRSSKNDSKLRLEGDRKGAGFYLPVASFDPLEVSENSDHADTSYQEEGDVDDHESYRHRNSDSDSSDEEDDRRRPQHRRHLLPSTTPATIKSSLLHLFTIIPNSILPSNKMTTTTTPEAETMTKDKNPLYSDGDVASVDSDAAKLAGSYSEFLLIPCSHTFAFPFRPLFIYLFSRTPTPKA